MKYDDASWHYGGDFPDGLEDEAGATHIGMFVAWALLADLGGEIHILEFPEELEKLKARQITPAQFFISACDEKFTDEDLNEVGNAFAKFYYDAQDAMYLVDYEVTLSKDLLTTYHVADTWSNFDSLKPVVDKRFEDWRASI